MEKIERLWKGEAKRLPLDQMIGGSLVIKEEGRMNRFRKIALKLLSGFDVNVKEDYKLIRALQKAVAPKVENDYHIWDRKIISKDSLHEIPVRIFRPTGELREGILLFFHGGGWVIGDIDYYTKACMTMAEKTGQIVLSVDYRLAPEHPYPKGLEDCYWVTRTIYEHLSWVQVEDSSGITLVGDSAGGNLAAAVALILRDEGREVPCKQILFYPATYKDHSEDSPYESIRTNGTDYLLTSQLIRDYMELYEPDPEKRKSPYIAPLMAQDLTGQPETLIITAEYDPLRDEGEAYGVALGEGGNRVVIHRVKDAVHGFLTHPLEAEYADEAYEVVKSFLYHEEDRDETR